MIKSYMCTIYFICLIALFGHIRLCKYVHLCAAQGYFSSPLRISNIFSNVVLVCLVVRDIVTFQKFEWPGSNLGGARLHFRNAIIAI